MFSKAIPYSPIHDKFMKHGLKRAYATTFILAKFVS